MKCHYKMRKPLTEEQKEAKRLYDIEYRNKNKDKTNERIKNWQKNNSEKLKEYSKTFYKNNSNIVKQNRKEYYINNINSEKEYNKKYSNENKDKIMLKQKEWRDKNNDYIKQYRKLNKDKINSYLKNRRDTDETYRIKINIRALIYNSFKKINKSKPSKTQEILGCCFEDFKQYLESKFESWMTWENYGNPKDGIFELNKTWDIDHIIPLTSGTTIDDIIKLNHYSNLQPLCSYNNRFIKKQNMF